MLASSSYSESTCSHYKTLLELLGRPRKLKLSNTIQRLVVTSSMLCYFVIELPFTSRLRSIAWRSLEPMMTKNLEAQPSHQN